MKEMNKEMRLNMDELEQVNGGGVCVVLGFGKDAASCFGNGAHVANDNEMVGGGSYACYVLGGGFAWTYEWPDWYDDNN